MATHLLTQPVLRKLITSAVPHLRQAIIEDPEGYDPTTDDRTHPTPDNMWEFGVAHDCDWTCSLYSFIASSALFTHLFMMAGPLGGWADGNLILLFCTLVTVVEFFNSSLMVWNINYYHTLSLAFRRNAFFLGFMQVCFWVSLYVGEVAKTMASGDTMIDSNHEIISSYLLVMLMPQFFLSLGTVIFAVQLGEIKNGNITDMDHDTGHLPFDHDEHWSL